MKKKKQKPEGSERSIVSYLGGKQSRERRHQLRSLKVPAVYKQQGSSVVRSKWERKTVDKGSPRGSKSICHMEYVIVT